MVSTHQPHNCSNYTPTPARPAPATAMAAELLSPLLPRRRRGLAVAAAAPLLALLLVAVIFFRAPLTTTVSSPERVDLTLVAGAREKGAVCLDGSPPAYQLRRGSGSGAHNWLIYLEGGSWCNTTQSCYAQTMSNFGSSKFMRPVNFSGILSKDHLENPGIQSCFCHGFPIAIFVFIEMFLLGSTY